MTWMAQAMEAADKNIKALLGSELVAVNPVSRFHSRVGWSLKPSAAQRPLGTQRTSLALLFNHMPSACRFLDVFCHYCGKKRHIASVCQTKKQGLPSFNYVAMPGAWKDPLCWRWSCILLRSCRCSPFQHLQQDQVRSNAQWLRGLPSSWKWMPEPRSQSFWSITPVTLPKAAP